MQHCPGYPWSWQQKINHQNLYDIQQINASSSEMGNPGQCCIWFAGQGICQRSQQHYTTQSAANFTETQRAARSKLASACDSSASRWSLDPGPGARAPGGDHLRIPLQGFKRSEPPSVVSAGCWPRQPSSRVPGAATGSHLSGHCISPSSGSLLHCLGSGTV